MARPLVRNLILVMALAVVLLAVFAGSGHRLRVLPGDASPEGVLLGAALVAICLTLSESMLRRLRCR
jgi:hypothetical protein